MIVRTSRLLWFIAIYIASLSAFALVTFLIRRVFEIALSHPT
jgi:hypothetical protein